MDIGVGEFCIGEEEFKLFFLAVVVVPTHYLLVFLWGREGLVFFMFLFCFWRFVCWFWDFLVRAHPCREGLYNRAARMVRGLDPGVG